MYTVFYLYRVKEENIQSFSLIHEKTSEILLANGALEYIVYEADDLNGKHGFRGLSSTIRLRKNEQLFFVQTTYRNKSHYEDVFNLVRSNPEKKLLFDELTKIVDFSKAVTASFTSAD